MKLKNIFKFNPIWGFDFKVTIDNHIVTMVPGQQIAIPVRLELIRGKSQQVDLDVNTNWESMGLTASIRFSSLTPRQPWKATLMIKASANTPPDSYLFTVRGSAKGTFHTSEDAVTVIVKPKGKQRSDEQGNAQPAQVGGAPNASFDLGDLFKPEAKPEAEPVKSGGVKNPRVFWTGIILLLGPIIFIIILAAAKGNGGTPTPSRGTPSKSSTAGCPTTCPYGIGVVVPQRCPCPAACPYTYIKEMTGGGLAGKGYKECANRPSR